jgi:Fe-S-cluster containining protein
MSKEKAVECLRCGKCCLADMLAYITREDIERWKKEKRDDIFQVIRHEQGVWAGDHFVSARTGEALHGCPFYVFDGAKFGCSIYETRPKTCRRYEPGSSEICPRFGKS